MKSASGGRERNKLRGREKEGGILTLTHALLFLILAQLHCI